MLGAKGEIGFVITGLAIPFRIMDFARAVGRELRSKLKQIGLEQLENK